MSIAELFPIRLPRLLDMDARDARIILATRSWCIFRRAALDPMPRMAEYLQSDIAATRLALLMNAVQQVWTEPFAVHRPCCAAASADEMQLIAMIRLATAERRPGFDTLLSEMLGSEARDLLFSRAATLYQEQL